MYFFSNVITFAHLVSSLSISKQLHCLHRSQIEIFLDPIKLFSRSGSRKRILLILYSSRAAFQTHVMCIYVVPHAKIRTDIISVFAQSYCFCSIYTNFHLYRVSAQILKKFSDLSRYFCLKFEVKKNIF